MTMPASHQDSKDGRLTEYMWWFSPRTKAQDTQPCLLTHLRANLALTLTKACAKSKNVINKHFGWLGGVEDMCRTSLNSSKLQMTGGIHIYSPPS